MANSPQYKAIIVCTVELVDYIAEDVANIANGLVAVSLISPNKASNMNLTRPNNEKANELIGAVRGQIRNRPEKFYVFLDVLRGFDHLSSLVDLLDSTCKSELDLAKKLANYTTSNWVQSSPIAANNRGSVISGGPWVCC